MVKISLTALNIDNKVVFAHNVSRKDGPFRCTFCHSDMVLRKGEVKTHHFAHKKDSNCPYATGETMEHELGGVLFVVSLLVLAAEVRSYYLSSSLF